VAAGFDGVCEGLPLADREGQGAAVGRWLSRTAIPGLVVLTSTQLFPLPL
jgi:hypothetical protein